jgi:hypothetical protein
LPLRLISGLGQKSRQQNYDPRQTFHVRFNLTLVCLSAGERLAGRLGREFFEGGSRLARRQTSAALRSATAFMQ